MATLNQNRSTITHIEVTFREIDRIYDLLPGTLLADTAPGKELVYKAQDNLMTRVDSLQWRGFLDEEGREVTGVEKRLLNGVYRGVRVTGYAPFLQSFLRDRSMLIDQKYVYVWSADASSGKAVELEYELYFQNGKFQKVSFDSAGNNGKDTRQPAGEWSDRLQLDVLSFWDASHAKEGYFFFLAPFQLPWAAVQDLNSTVAVRGVKLWDWFYTDIYTAADPTTAKPISHDILKGKTPIKMMFQMHLVDPFKEGLNRSARYGDMLRRWEPAQQKLGKNSEYLLAVRVSDFAHSSSELLEKVDKEKLSDAIYKPSREANRLLALSIFRCAELLRWIGESRQPDTAAPPGVSQGFNTWVVEGHTAIGMTQSLPGDWHSPFSNAVDDYAYGPADIHVQVGQIVNRVHGDLDLCADGDLWLEKNLNKFFSGDSLMEGERPALDVAHGGASILFQYKRKLFEGAEHLNAGLLRDYAKPWVRKFRSESLKDVKGFLKKVHGIEVDLMQKPRPIRPQRLRRAKREIQECTPKWVERLEFAHHELSLVALSVESVNLSYAWDEFQKEHHNLKTSLELAASVIDGYRAVTEVVEKLPNPEIPLYKIGSRAVKFCPLAAAAAALEVTTAGMDAAKARTADEGVAHGIRAVGAALCLAGTFTEEFPPLGLILMVGGFVLQSAGSYVVGSLSSASRFLRFCQWGTGRSLLSGDFRDSQDEDWYKGNLSDLAKSVNVQVTALDNIIYDYLPKIGATGEDSKVILYAKMREAEEGEKSKLISPEAKWNVRAELYRKDFGSAPRKVVGFGSKFVDSGNVAATRLEDVEDGDLTEGEECELHTFQSPMRTPPTPSLPYPTIGPEPPPRPWDEPDFTVRVKITAELDVFGDGKCIIKRELDDSVNLLLHTSLTP